MRQRVTWGLALSLALGLSLSLTACLGPTVITAGSQAGPYHVAIQVDPPEMQAGQKATLNFFFTDPANGNKPVTNLAIVHERPLHLFIVDRALAYFKHDQSPGVSPTNAYPVNIEFGPEGTYYLYAEFAPTVIVTDTTTGKKVPRTGDTVVYTGTISFGTTGRAEQEPAPLSEDTRSKNAGGVTVAISGTTDLHVGQPATFVFTLSERGVPIHTLAAYLGEAGHLVILDEHGGHFAHTAALESMGQTGAGGAGGSPEAGTPTTGLSGLATAFPSVAPTATGLGGFPVPPTTVPSTELGGGIYGPSVTFQHTFDAPGLYKLWGQFLYRGQVLTADFVVNVQP